MASRCLLFSSDEETSRLVCQILADLGIDAEHCTVAVQAVEQVTKLSFQLVIVDWDNQPEAVLLLNAARERKASERPLALAIVAMDASVPQALQAGANSVLRKPVLENQARDTLTTAQGLLRAKLEPRPAVQAAAAGAGSSTSVIPRELPPGADSEKNLRAGEFLQSAPTPSTQFVIESEVPKSFDQPVEAVVDPLKDLEPMAAAVDTQEAVQEPPARALPEPNEARGLAWYMKRAGTAAAPAPEPPSGKADLLSYAETPSHTPAAAAEEPAPRPAPASNTDEHEKKTEAALFAYISGETPESNEPKPPRKIGKMAVIVGLAAGLVVAYFVVPQSIWKPRVQALAGRGAKAIHNWLNPQPAVPAQAPKTYESFARAGDEYKLPVAETIPDATTDPSQIRVLPVVDPTAKHPNGANANQEQAVVDTSPKDNPDAAQVDPAQSDPAQISQDPSTIGSPVPQGGTAAPPISTPPIADTPAQPVSTQTSAVHSEPAVSSPVVVPMHTQPVVTPTPRAETSPSGSIPSSLRSQMASMTPDASGNKPVEAALPSIEPVELPEATARSLILVQADPAYPQTAKGQQGTIVLQLLIGRDGAVQDAKFMQGSLAFARAASDAVRQWKFKPYLLNARPVSVRTVLTLHFKPSA